MLREWDLPLTVAVPIHPESKSTKVKQIVLRYVQLQYRIDAIIHSTMYYR